jgi:hypothetical protein
MPVGLLIVRQFRPALALSGKGLGELLSELTDPDVVCCFCARSLRASAAATISVAPPGLRDQTQELWAHAACLQAKVDRSIPMHPHLWGETEGPDSTS